MNLEDLTAVVLNWRTADLTVRSARALLADGLPADRLVIVDNASGDGSAEKIAAALDLSVLVALDENVGFARANNLGARALPAQGYLFVNSDAFVHMPGSLSRLASTLDDARVGIAVPRLLNEDMSLQPSVVPLSALLPESIRASGLSRLLPNVLQPLFGTHWDHSVSREIQAAIGPVLLVRGSTWDALSGYDERSYMYAEDLDLFRRARKLGWTAHFVADAVFVHVGGASSSIRWSQSERAERVARAEAAIVRDHLGPVQGRLTLGVMATGVGARMLVRYAFGDPSGAAIQRAWLRGYLGR